MMRRRMIQGCLVFLASGFFLLHVHTGGAEAPADKDALRYDGKTFEFWRRYMRTELKAERRIDALRALAEFGMRGHAQSAAKAIVDAIKEYGEDAYGGDAEHATPDQNVIRTAAEAIGKIGPAAFEIVVRNAKDANVRRFALLLYNHPPDKSVNVLSPSTVRKLIEFARGDHLEARKFAVELLSDAVVSGPPSEENVRTALRAEKDTAPFVHALIEYLEKDQLPPIQYVFAALGPRAKPATAALVKARLRGDDVSEETFKAIGVKTTDLIPDFIEGLKSKETRVRFNAAEWLGERGREAKPAVSALLHALRDFPKPARDPKQNASGYGEIADTLRFEEYEKARLAAIVALGLIGAQPQKVVPFLAEIIAAYEESRPCRLAAANALMKFGSQAKTAMPTLLNVFTDDGEPDEVRSSALLAVEQFGVGRDQVVPSLIKEIERRLKRHDKNNFAADDLTAQSITYLAKLHPQAREAFPLLLQAFNHFYTPENLLLIIPEALGEMGPAARDALPALREQLKSRDPAKRKAAKAAIAKIEGKEKK